MFSSALKSFTSNIASNYTIAPQPSCTSGPWKIFDARKKGQGSTTVVSVFVFDKKILDPAGGRLRGSRTGAASLKRAYEDVLDRLKKEASSLARLRHPSILELAEPVEETRNGGLMFATEPVTASLAGLLLEKDDEERSGGVGGRGSRYVVEESDGRTRRRELELDELEIQKGLLQIGKGLEFLHDSAALVHGNISPDAIFVNQKSDWKISGLAFSASPTNLTSALSEILNHDPRLPPSVQLNLDYTSPDFVIDQNVSGSADMFSLGLLILALYNSPHRSPLNTHGSLSSYKRMFSSSSTIPTQQNSFLSAGKLPKDLASDLLPRLITRRPAQRLNATEFQQARYFDNILVSTIRFLDGFPAKTPNEKTQFMRGLPRIMPQFPRSVLEKKILPVLLEEMKDHALLAPILQNVFAIVRAMPSGKRTFTESVIPRLQEIFLTASNTKAVAERDTAKESGLMIVLENMSLIAQNCSGKEFRDDILPIIALGLGSQTHSLVDAALSTLSSILPVLDYSTIKNELFPVIANVFAHTNSLAIKIRGLEAIYALCGGTEAMDNETGDGLDGVVVETSSSKNTSSSVLDKYTIQEKVVPLIKSIKTKEPGVMMAALRVLRQAGKIADSDFLALEVLPILWTFALGPLLDLHQFQSFMSLIKALCAQVEREQTRKLQDLSTANGSSTSRMGSKANTWANGPTDSDSAGGDVDFASLVSGRKSTNGTPDMLSGWGSTTNGGGAPLSSISQPPTASISQFSKPTNTIAKLTPPPKSPSLTNVLRAAPTRTVTPDQTLNTAFSALTPNSPFSQALQPQASSNSSNNSNTSFPASTRPMIPMSTTTTSARPNTLTPQPATTPAIDWSAASAAAAPSSSSNTNSNASSWSLQRPPVQSSSSFSIAPPPQQSSSSSSFSSLAPLQMQQQQQGNPGFSNMHTVQRSIGSIQQQQQQQLSGGLDKYQSLL
ncbi:hypothetical protein AAFC00_005377 [Neodothiora populina]|uniref:Protein kinase domain-containing protein n=1 Tax=Neodothiora populina TaxID=2781224 RepID=A0ABR3PKP2_9PEZI